MAKSSKRKASPKPTYRYEADETAPAGSKKRGVTGGIKKVKTSPDKPTPRKNVVTRRNPKEEIVARQSGEEAKRLTGDAFRKRQEKEVGGELTQGRRVQLQEQLEEGPFRSAELPKRKKGLKASRADLAAGPAEVPARGTRPGAAPRRPDRGGEAKTKKVEKVVDGKPVVVTEDVTIPVKKGLGAPDAITAKGSSTSERTVRSEGSIRETRRRAASRLPGGLKTTQYSPMDTAARSTSGDRKTRRTEAKLRRRAKTGKTNLPRRYGMGAVAAAVAATEAATPPGTPTPVTSGQTVGAFMFSDESLAQELARTHFKGHSASDIMDYVKHTGSDMGSFHRHVTEAHKAETKRIKVGSGNDVRERSAGKITRWRVDPKTGDATSERSYEGWQQVKVRDASGANVKTWKKFSAPKGTIGHIEYLHGQITKHKEMRAMAASDTRERNRARRVADTTSSIVEAMTPVAAVPTEPANRPPKGRSGKYRVSAPRPEGAVGPELESGKFSERTVTPEKPTFTEIKVPKKRNLNP